MEISKLIVAMKDFADEVTFGDIELIGKSDTLLDQAHKQFKRVAVVLNDANLMKDKTPNGDSYYD